MKNSCLALLILLASLFLLMPDKAHALSCAELSGPQEALARNGAAVYGEVKQVECDIDQAGFTGTK